MKILGIILAIIFGGLAGLIMRPANSQTFSGTVQNHAVPIGKGPGVSGMTSLLPGAAATILQSNGAAADPSYASVALLLDSICTTRGSVLFRNATVWLCLTPGTVGQPLQTGGAGADPSYATLPTTTGGTGLTAGTSGGVLYFNSATSNASSAALTASRLVLGGGAGAAPSTPVTLGTTTTVLHGNAAGNPSFGAVDLNNDTSGTLSSSRGGTDQTAVTQGDLLFGSTVSGWDRLAKNTSSTRYLSNTGASNGPAWAQVALTTGVTGTLPVANGGTGVASTTAYAVITGGTTSTNPLQSIASVGSSGQVLTSNGAGALPSFQAPPGLPTIQTFTTGSGTYTPTANAKTIIVEMVGGGGGGGGSGTGGPPGNGGAGGNSTFNAGAIVSGGGLAGAGATGGNSLGGGGGSASGGTINIVGGWGGSTFTALAGVTFPGGQGGSSFFGGGGAGSNTGNAGQIGSPNSGGGGGGAGTPVSGGAGSGGGSGGYTRTIITGLAANYTYAVGAAGTAGAAGTGGNAGGVGGVGIIIVTEYY